MPPFAELGVAVKWAVESLTLYIVETFCCAFAVDEADS